MTYPHLPITIVTSAATRLLDVEEVAFNASVEPCPFCLEPGPCLACEATILRLTEQKVKLPVKRLTAIQKHGGHPPDYGWWYDHATCSWHSRNGEIVQDRQLWNALEP